MTQLTTIQRRQRFAENVGISFSMFCDDNVVPTDEIQDFGEFVANTINDVAENHAQGRDDYKWEEV